MGTLQNIAWTIGVVLAIFSSIFIYTTIGGSSSIIGILFLLAAVVITLLCGVLVYQRFKKESQPTAIMNSHAVVESLKRVFKVITAEGHFTEIVDFKDTKQTLSLLPSTKKALIIVKAKVMMGYDFSEMEWDVDELNNTVRLKKMPQLKLLSNSTDINYYNMENGLFNRFTNEDLNVIKDQCTAQIAEVAWQSELPTVAVEQANMLLTELGKMHDWNIDKIDYVPVHQTSIGSNDGLLDS
jgi:hypothetical protein